MQNLKFRKTFEIATKTRVALSSYICKYPEPVKAFIKAISYHLPEKEFPNEEFFKIFQVPEEQKENLLRAGVRNRRIVAEGELASDLGVQAALKLFEEHKIDPADIDFLLFCAQEFDHFTPTTACIMQQRLNLPRSAGALDFNLGCSGYIYGLSLARGLVESTGMKNVLLITSSTLTRTFHPGDRSSRFLFGDGAAATLISAGYEGAIGEFIFGTDGSGKDKIIVRDGGARNCITDSSHIEKQDEYGNVSSDAKFYMNGTGVFIFGLKTVPRVVQELFAKEKRKLSEYDLFIFHQANEYLIEAISKKIGIPADRVFNYMADTGNTVSSTIPIALKEAMNAGVARKGHRVMLIGFGVGLSWGATSVCL